ncbi:MAG: flagellar hook-basal body complex protein [Planctomycetia bacterium]|nr:flagellar hook-basal body complex protein [Planctomycetia bacterium]
MGFGGALYSGVSGIRAHQRMLDIIGNNLANINTYGFKSSRLLFSDMLSQTMAIGANGNTMQVGKGVKFASISSDFRTGDMETTTNPLDVAIDGEGFFVVNGGSQDFFTRVGAFDIDSNNYLIDSTTQYNVLDVNSNNIIIPKDSTVSGKATSKIDLKGNLNAKDIKEEAEVLIMDNILAEGGTAATTATELNDLDTNTTDYVAGDIIRISGTQSDGTTVSATYTYAAGDTVAELIAAINTAYSGDATASLDASGKIILKADTSGNDKLTLDLTDNGSNTGKTTWTEHTFGGSTYTSSVNIFDTQGTQHTVSLRFTKQMDNKWDLTASMDSKDGTFASSDNTITGITFNNDGTFSASGDTTLQFKFNGISTTQSVIFDPGTSGKKDGIIQNGSYGSSIDTSQDGYGFGKYDSLSIDSAGTIKIKYTNGIIEELTTLKLALFNNLNGLNKVGNNLYEQTASSGEAIYASANSGRAGSIRSGALEGSNVDMATELTSLITAQRGFQLNTKVITTADEILAEVVNLKR